MRSLSFLSKLTLFGLLLSTLPVIFIGTFSYMTSSKEILKKVNQGNFQLVRQINSNVEQKLITVNHTLNQVVSSPVLKKALNMPLNVSDFKTYNDLRTEIRNMQSMEVKVEDVVLVDTRQNWMIKNSGLYQFDQYGDSKGIAGLLSLDDTVSWTLTPTSWFYSEETANSVSCEYSISLVKKLPSTGLEKYGMAIANIPTCSLRDFIEYNPDGTDSQVIIMDEQFRLLLDPDTSLIGKPAAENGLADIGLLTGDSGQFTTRIGGVPSSVTYYRSELNGWYYLLVTSMGSLTRESGKIGSFTIYICLFLLISCILLAWGLSRRMYSPIERLLNQFGERRTDIRRRRTNEFQVIGEQMETLFQSKTRLEKEAGQHLQQVRSFFMIKAFQGAFRQGELTEKLEQYGFGHQLREWKKMAVITLQIDLSEKSRYGKKDLDLLLFAVQNIIEELIPAEQRLSPVVMDHTLVAMIGSPISDEAEFNTFFYALSENVQHAVSRYLDIQASIGMSLPTKNVANLPIAYREGLESLKHRIHLGQGIIIQYRNINSGKHYLNLNYPVHLEAELTDAIKLAEEEPARTLLHEFLKSVLSADLAPHEYQIPLARLLNNLLIVMQESGISLKQIYRDEGSLFEELLNLHTSEEIEEWFRSTVVLPLIHIFRDRQDAQYHTISKKIIDLIHQSYDEDVTLEEIASKLHYNANYLSGVFRKETDSTFYEYLSAYRFNMAKKWLAETDMPIKDIATRLRYNNSQNFIRSFRKQEGMTPGQYRERYKKLG